MKTHFSLWGQAMLQHLLQSESTELALISCYGTPSTWPKLHLSPQPCK